MMATLLGSCLVLKTTLCEGIRASEGLQKMRPLRYLLTKPSVVGNRCLVDIVMEFAESLCLVERKTC